MIARDLRNAQDLELARAARRLDFPVRLTLYRRARELAGGRGNARFASALLKRRFWRGYLLIWGPEFSSPFRRTS